MKKSFPDFWCIMIFNRVFYGLCGESVTTVMTFELHFHFELHFRITLSFIFSNFLIFFSSSASQLVRSACGRHLGHSYLIQLVELRITLSRWATRCDMRVLAFFFTFFTFFTFFFPECVMRWSSREYVGVRLRAPYNLLHARCSQSARLTLRL